MFQINVTFDLKGLKAFRESVGNQLNSRQNGVITTVLRQWAARYRAFIQMRFDTYSKGGGNWAALADSTISRRRKPAKAKKVKSKKPTKTLAQRKEDLKKKLRNKGKGLTSKAFRRLTDQYRKLVQKIKVEKAKKANKKSKERKHAILRDTGTLFNALAPTFAGVPGQLEQAIENGIKVGIGGPWKHSSKSAATIADIASYHNNGTPRIPKRTIIVDPDTELLQDMAGDLQRGLDKLANENT